MKPTTVLTSSGEGPRHAVGPRLQVCWSTPWWALADSAEPWPVSKYMTLSPTVPRFSDRAAVWASSSSAR
jgi:hypothetical protein